MIKTTRLRLDTPDIRRRLLSAMILIPLVLLCIQQGGMIYAAVVTLGMALGLREWLRMVDPHAGTLVNVATYLALLFVMGVGTFYGAIFGALLAIPLMLGLFLLAARRDIEKAGWLITGIPYLAGSGLCLLFLRNEIPEGLQAALFLIGIVWATDTAGYFGGKFFNGPKLLPEISPHKTWSGFLAGLTAAALIGLVLAKLFEARFILIMMALAVILSVVSQLGDLFESYVKRRTGVKDSGGLIPGHGGILDRIDGLLFAAVFMVLFEIATRTDGSWW